MASITKIKIDKTTIVLAVLLFWLFCHSMLSWYLQHRRQILANVEIAQALHRQSQERIFVNCMISGGKDTKTGEPVIWFGTEDKGVFRVAGEKVENFGVESGLIADCVYALAIDRQDRLWVGTLNQGVCVYNGESWKNYDVVDGPLGERIFDIQVCPVDGDVWMATSAGITRYSPQTDTWQHYNCEDGLLEDQASSLAFDAQGNLIVGTQCHGLSFLNRGGNGQYRVAKNVTAPFRFGPDNCSPVPLTHRGTGLPSDLINQILIAGGGTIYVATNAGLAWSKNDGATWNYLRGQDYADKVRGLYGGAPEDWKEVPMEDRILLLPEDHITCLAEDPATGLILFGTRQKGLGVFDPIKERCADNLNMYWQTDNHFVRTIVPLPDGRLSFGCYLGGYAIIDPGERMALIAKFSGGTSSGNPMSQQPVSQVADKNFATHPSPIKPPTMAELKVMQTKLESLTEPLPDVYASYYGEDWKTQGDWMGRYGRDWALLCGTASPFDHPVNFSCEYFCVYPTIGPHHPGQKDALRRWVHWIKTDNPRSLWNPYNGYRRQAEWDDHGEEFPLSIDGPDLWYLLEVKHEGVFRVGMYFFNKDGQDGRNRLRDYLVEVYSTDEKWRGDVDDAPLYGRHGEALTGLTRPLLKSRVYDFWGGVYKQFVVSGPANYMVKIDRSYGYNTILSSVMIDQLYGEPTLYVKENWGVPLMEPITYNAPAFPEENVTEDMELLKSLWHKLDHAQGFHGSLKNQRKHRIGLLQMASSIAEAAPEDQSASTLAKSLKWRLNQWDEEQRLEWKDTVQLAWQTFYDSNESLRLTIEEQKKGVPDFIKNREPTLYD